VFDSVWATAMVMLSLPIALAGVVAAFWVAGAAFGREAAVGVILVVGLAVNQAILLVDGALERRVRQMGRWADGQWSGGDSPSAHPPVRSSLSGSDIVRVARDRSGMIILVTLTTLASLLPLAIGTDADSLFGSIALATAGGTVFGTLAAMLVLPAMVVGTGGDTKPRKRRFAPS
ncbi:MAG TPA: efflux RND transporter permease subunit, partial [Gemmatimonadales bacterium]|nr:efflux RND transporter permease subunit [Gemmatimonadales bacterium]